MTENKTSSSAKKKSKKNLTSPKEKFTEALETTSSKVNIEQFKKLDHDELKEIYQLFSDIREEETLKKIEDIYKDVYIPAIEKAKLGHRIWSYFYEKYPIRIIIILWLILGTSLKKLIPFEIKLPVTADFSKMPTGLRDFLFSADSTAIPLGMILYILVPILILIGWRIFLSFLESNRNSRFSGSFFTRSKLGIAVVDKYGKPLPWGKSFLRGLFRIFPISFITVALTECAKNNRGPHDKLFGSYVLRLNEDVNKDQIEIFIKQNYL